MQNALSGSSFESQESYAALVLLQNKPEEQKELDLDFSRSLTRRKSIKEIKEISEGGELKWNKEGGALPSI